jgi:hypothetical protein
VLGFQRIDRSADEFLCRVDLLLFERCHSLSFGLKLIIKM